MQAPLAGARLEKSLKTLTSNVTVRTILFHPFSHHFHSAYLRRISNERHGHSAESSSQKTLPRQIAPKICSPPTKPGLLRPVRHVLELDDHPRHDKWLSHDLRP